MCTKEKNPNTSTDWKLIDEIPTQLLSDKT